MLPKFPLLSRRQMLLAAGGVLVAGATGLRPDSAAAAVNRRLVAKPDRVQLVGRSYPKTDVWCDDGVVPGPELTDLENIGVSLFWGLAGNREGAQRDL